MSKYGQYCPIARALELVGDRWTLLIIRDMLTGTRHFNDLIRGLPGLSTGLLAKRLRQLERAGIVRKQTRSGGRKTTEYHLTDAGIELHGVINALLTWGAFWAFGEPTLEELDPLLLMWWMHDRVDADALPDERVVAQFDFRGAKTETYWLVLAREDITVCITDPGYAVDVLVEADLAALFRVWLGHLDYAEAVAAQLVSVKGIPRLTRAFPRWFTWSLAAPAVRAAAARATTR